MTLLWEFRRITLQLGKIEIKINFLILFFIFIFYLLTDNSFVLYGPRDFWYKVQKKAKKICEKKRASRLEGCQIVVCLGGCMGGKYIHTYIHTLSKWCPSILWDSHSLVWRTETNMFTISYHAHQRFHSLFLHLKRMVRFFFYYIHFFICCFL